METRKAFLFAAAAYLYSIKAVGPMIKWLAMIALWLFNGGFRWLYLAKNTMGRDLRLLVRGVRFLAWIRYIKMTNR